MKTALLLVLASAAFFLGITYLGWFQLPDDSGRELVATSHRAL